MPALFQGFLIWHILLGITAVALSVFVLVALFKDRVNLKVLKIASTLSLLGFLGSWVLGGYYYVYYYGSNVKPIIKAGDYAWAHKVIMETKEHVFLFLPFLATIVALSMWMFGHRLDEDRHLKYALRYLVLVLVVIGVIITLMGAAISGAYR